MPRSSTSTDAVWTASLLLIACAPVGCTAGLRFKPDGTFKIVQLTDLHFGQDEMDDMRTVQVVRTVLEQEEGVDLVVFSGDMLSGWMGRGVPGWAADKYPRIPALASSRQLPYAMVLGNHDPQADLNRRQLVELDMRQPGSLTQRGPDHLPGASNYWLSVASARQPGAEALRIWMLDSEEMDCRQLRKMGRGCCDRRIPDWLHKHASNASGLPALAFVHIPPPEFMAAWNEGTGAFGLKKERVCCALQSHCLFTALQRAGVTAVYSGHDHSNNYVATHKGVRLGYGTKTGYSSYGPPAGWQHGARVLLLREGQAPGEGDTWLRQEDGGKHVQAAAAPRLWSRQNVCSK